MFFILHETDCTKQFFTYAKLFYPKLNVVSEHSFDGVFYFSRFALSKEDAAVYATISDQSAPTALVVLELDEVTGISGEGKPDKKTATKPKTRAQLLANMSNSIHGSSVPC